MSENSENVSAAGAAENQGSAKSNNSTMLIVLGGIGCGIVMLLCIAVPAAREAERRMQCRNNEEHIGMALHNYLDTYKEALPPAMTFDENGKPLHSWRVLILPYMESSTLYPKIRLDEPWDSDYNRQFHDQVPRVYQCPSAKGDMTGMTSYSLVVGKECYSNEPNVKQNVDDIKDGLSNTIFLVERKTPVCWMDPTQEITFEKACEGANVSADGLGSNHPGGINVCMFDGCVSFLSNTIDRDTVFDQDTLHALFSWSSGASWLVP